jgi:hypothetical protein
VQGESFATSGSQPIEVKTGRPGFVPFQRVLLSLVAEIPDDPRASDKTPKLAETSTFRPEPRENPTQGRALFTGASAKVSLPEER